MDEIVFWRDICAVYVYIYVYIRRYFFIPVYICCRVVIVVERY